MESRSPATGELLGTVPEADAGAVRAAVAAAAALRAGALPFARTLLAQANRSGSNGDASNSGGSPQ